MNGYDDRGTALDPGLTALALRARARTDESYNMMLLGIVMGLVLGVPSGLLLGGLCEANGEDTAATEAPPGGRDTVSMQRRPASRRSVMYRTEEDA